MPKGWPRDDAPFTFVTDGVESAVAQAKELAGDKIVAIATPSITQQCLNLGLLDVIRVNLVPVLLGDGIRFFDNLRDAPIMLDDPTVTESTRVTHSTACARRERRPRRNQQRNRSADFQITGHPTRKSRIEELASGSTSSISDSLRRGVGASFTLLRVRNNRDTCHVQTGAALV